MRRVLISLGLLLITLQAAAQMEWHDPMAENEPPICGRAWNKEIGKEYLRMPRRMKPLLRKEVWSLAHHTAGLYLHFNTNTSHIWVRYVLTGSTNKAGNMSALGHSGVDLYAYDREGRMHWLPNQMYYNLTLKHQSDTVLFRYDDAKIPAAGAKGWDYVLYLPTYNSVQSLQVGVDEGTTFKWYVPSQDKPIVVYGTSITQGAASSRPGMIWTTILERETGLPVINLGFSGNALMEPEVFDAVAETDARAYIIDCIPNSFRFYKGQEIQTRYPAGIRKIRAKSDAPIIMAECIVGDDQLFVSKKDAKKRAANKILRQVYEQLKAEGVKGLYYISAEDFSMPRDAMVEGTHPNDIGMQIYARTYEKALAKLGLLSGKK